jgi:hypothetical protein
VDTEGDVAARGLAWRDSDGGSDEKVKESRRRKPAAFSCYPSRHEPQRRHPHRPRGPYSDASGAATWPNCFRTLSLTSSDRGASRASFAGVMALDNYYGRRFLASKAVVWMIFPDLTPTYVAPLPADRLLRVVRSKVTELWIHDRRLADVRSSSWEEVLLAARYFHRRREVLETFPSGRGRTLSDSSMFMFIMICNLVFFTIMGIIAPSIDPLIIYVTAAIS